jgi:Na+-translocating ferredoxin:NAD+ oxidoreductase subunit B
LDSLELRKTEAAFKETGGVTAVPVLRTIQVGQHIQINHHVTTFENTREIIEKTNGPIVVLECFCRKGTLVKGKPCPKTTRLETCLILDDTASSCIKAKLGRRISREEALEITRLNDADGLVFQVSTTSKVSGICACCECCCSHLHRRKMFPKSLISG